MVRQAHRLTLSLKQTQAWDMLNDPAVSELLYGGAKGGGKSVFACYWALSRSLEIIEEFNLERKQQASPLPVGFMGRKQSIDFKTTTLDTWRRFVPPQLYVIREQAQEIIIRGLVKIRYGGLDRSEDVQKFNSAEYAFIVIDQAEETTRDDISVLRASLRLIIDGKKPQYKALFTANPRDCWLRDDFVYKPRDDQRFVPALPTDNPHLDASYIRTLENAFKHRPELLRAYLHGEWDCFEVDNQVIRRKWLEEAALRRVHTTYPRRLVACDIAREGDDETVIYCMEETEIVRRDVFGQRDSHFIQNVLFLRQKWLGGALVAIDGTGGWGAGPTDNLRSMGVTVLEFVASRAADDKERYYNLRAQAWWEAAEMFSDGTVCLHDADEELLRQLTIPTYDFRNGRILIEDKKDIKKRIGRSPDHADAYIIGLYALREAWSPQQRQEQQLRRNRGRYVTVGGEDVSNDWRAM